MVAWTIRIVLLAVFTVYLIGFLMGDWPPGASNHGEGVEMVKFIATKIWKGIAG